MEKTKLGNWLKTKFGRENKASMENIYETLLLINNVKDATIVKQDIALRDKDKYAFELLGRLSKAEALNIKASKDNDRLFEYLDKIAVIVNGLVTDNKELRQEVKNLIKCVEDLKSDRYKVVKIKESKGRKDEGAKQEIKVKTPKSSVTSKIIKKVKPND